MQIYFHINIIVLEVYILILKIFANFRFFANKCFQVKLILPFFLQLDMGTGWQQDGLSNQERIVQGPCTSRVCSARETSERQTPGELWITRFVASFQLTNTLHIIKNNIYKFYRSCRIHCLLQVNANTKLVSNFERFWIVLKIVLKIKEKENPRMVGMVSRNNSTDNEVCAVEVIAVIDSLSRRNSW